MSALYSIERKTTIFSDCLINEYASYFQHLTIINNTAMNIPVLMPLCAGLSRCLADLSPKLYNPTSTCKPHAGAQNVIPFLPSLASPPPLSL